MTLAELTVTQLRCIEHAQLEIPPGLALICGGNGSGKSGGRHETGGEGGGNGGEEEKVEWEPRKMLGKYIETLEPPSSAASHGDASQGTPPRARVELADIKFSAHTNRVAVTNGHTVCASVEFTNPADPEAAEAVLRDYRAPASANELPSSPRPVIEVRNEADRPQPRLDRLTGKGMTTVVGRVRRDPILDLKFVSCRVVREIAA